MASTGAPPPYSINNSTSTHKTETSSFECIGSTGDNLESQRWAEQPVESSVGEGIEPLWKPSLVDWLTILMLLLLSMMITIDGTILASILPSLTASLKMSSADAFWCGTGYLLSCAITQPYFTTLSGFVQRRCQMLLALGLFTAGTLICCLSKHFAQMISGRVIQGIGAGGVASGSFILLADLVPLRERPMYCGLVVLFGAVGAVIGPLLGGLFIDHLNWRWAFYINFPFLLVIFGQLIFVPLPLQHTQESTHRIGSLDWAGGVLFLTSAGSFLIGLSWGGVQYPWNSWKTYVPIILGGLGLIATMFWEGYMTPNPILHIHLFKSVRQISAYILVFFHGFLNLSELYCIPIYFQSAKLRSATSASITLIPITAAILPAAAVTGILITRFGYIHWPLWLSWIITVIATGCLISWDTSTTTVQWALNLVAVGVGHGITLSSLNSCVQVLADPKDTSYAFAMYAFVRTIGMCVGVPVGGTTFSNRLKFHAHNLGLPAEIGGNMVGAIDAFKDMTATAEQVEVFKLAYARAFRNVAEALTGIAVLGLIVSVFVRRVRL
ncbi:major facilitator superfamily domain-containing protein [Aspergillus pseudotamarii]|uniref:Major facilitator superfamily domain-containing protein n=1 Tax=Aspergillus pseudotamarii TaxID=132259 RepID=A0A5N6T0L6_ASPPS|nr:major facilitator superfamily domain-containing protein [Aspergillus pseudotamarii]KAE8139094.1 major facilitator superfamily domain-containing protein [Aspergillus pseudotamarii]